MHAAPLLLCSRGLSDKEEYLKMASPKHNSFPSEWNRKLHDRLLRASISLDKHGKHSDAVSCFVAAHRLKHLTVSDVERNAIEQSKVWERMCWGIVLLASTNPTVMVVCAALMHCQAFKTFPGWLELFSLQDLAYIVLGPDGVSESEASCESAILTACRAKSIDGQANLRFFAIGFIRFKQWLRMLKRNQPPSTPSKESYDALELDLSLAYIDHLVVCLGTWEKLTTEAKSFDGIDHSRDSFRHVEVLMKDETYAELNRRAVGFDTSVGLISTLHPLLQKGGVVKDRTLVISGESGSGKTLSILALDAGEAFHLRVHDGRTAGASRSSQQGAPKRYVP